MRHDDKARNRRAEYLKSRPVTVASDLVAMMESRYQSEGFKYMLVIIADTRNVGVIGMVPTTATAKVTADLELVLANGYAAIGVVGLHAEGSNGGLRVYAIPLSGYENNQWAEERIHYVRLNLDKMMDEKNLHTFEPREVN